ncbi:MAG: YncE family protein, partial [Pseudonocardiaceae bacterium]
MGWDAGTGVGGRHGCYRGRRDQPGRCSAQPEPHGDRRRRSAGVAVDFDNKHAYVASYSDNSVRVIDTAAERVVGSIGVGAGPRGVAVDPDSRHAFVTNYLENSVSV